MDISRIRRNLCRAKQSLKHDKSRDCLYNDENSFPICEINEYDCKINGTDQKDLSSLNCEDLFPNPPKYIPDIDQTSNHDLNDTLDCDLLTFAGFSDDGNKTSPDFLTNHNDEDDDNDVIHISHSIGENSCSNNSHDQYSNDPQNEKYNIEDDSNTRNSSTSLSKSCEQSSVYEDIDMEEEQEQEPEKDQHQDNLEDLQSKKINGKIPCKVKFEIAQNKEPRLQNNYSVDVAIKIEDKNLSRATGISLPASSPSLSLSSYYSSAESVSSDTTSNKKKKRHCLTCDMHFRHTRDLLKHLRMHVKMPFVCVTKLSENDVNYKRFLQRQSGTTQTSTEQSSSGGLKLKLKLSSPQNFEIVKPTDEKSSNPTPTPIPTSSPNQIEENPKKVGGIRVLKAQEIKPSSPSTPVVPPIDAMTAMTQIPQTKETTSDNSLDNRYFECPTFDVIEQFNDNMEQEATEDLLKKLLECNSQQIPQDTDWSMNTNEFISIDRLAHICTVCNKSFSDDVGLYEHKRSTGHDFSSSMRPPPPPKSSASIANNQYNSMRRSPQLQHPQHRQMDPNQGYPSCAMSTQPQLTAQHLHMQQLQHSSQLSSRHPSQQLSQRHSTQHPSQHPLQHSSQHLSQHPLQHPPHHSSLHPLHNQMSSLAMRPGCQGYSSQSSQRYPGIMPPNYAQSSQIMGRRPPPLYRVPSPQNVQPGAPPFNDLNMNQEMYYSSNSNAIMNRSVHSSGSYPNGPIPSNMIRPPMFLKARLQRAIRPKSPNSSPSPPAVMCPQQITRSKLLRSEFTSPQLMSAQLSNPHMNTQLISHLNSQGMNGNHSNGPPVKKVKHEQDDCEVVATQPRIDGLPIIQSVQGGASLPSIQDNLDKSKDALQLNDQVTLSLKNKESNKNPKEVANILANRGITVTHKSKNGSPHEDTSNKNVLTQEAVQKLQLNNSVSIISKKKNEMSSNNSNSSSGNDEPTNNKLPTLKSGTSNSDSPFISCPIPDCEEKFLTQESLNRHTQRGHRMNKVNLKAFRCKVCPAMFSTQEGLVDHQRRTHRLIKTSADELGIPIIDLRNEQTKQKLASLGIINYIPLSSKGSNGYFGFPIVSVQGAANPNVCNVLGMGINSILSLGPIKPIPIKKTDL